MNLRFYNKFKIKEIFNRKVRKFNFIILYNFFKKEIKDQEEEKTEITIEEFLKIFPNKKIIYEELNEQNAFLDNIENMSSYWLVKHYLSEKGIFFLYFILKI